MKFRTFIILFIFPFCVLSQNVNPSYSFLNSEISPRSLAMGGDLISIYDKLSKSGEFSKIQDEFDHMMAFIKDMETNWKNENSQDVKVVVNDIHYKPADQQ